MNKIAIFSVPRSGSSWVGQIFNSHPEVLFRFQPNFAYSFNYQLSESDSEEDINNFFKALISTNDPFVSGKLTISSKKGISFRKDNPKALVFKETHYLNVISNLLANSNTKVIGLIRSPFAVINSWIKVPKEFHQEWSIDKEWRKAELKNNRDKSHYFGYEKWKEAAYLFLELQKEFPEQFYLLKYESLLTDKLATVKDFFSFCGLELESQTLDFLNQASNNNNKDPYSVFKKKFHDDNWKGELPQFIIDEIKADKNFKKLNEIIGWIT